MRAWRGWLAAAASLALGWASAGAAPPKSPQKRPPPLYDPVALNIGINCQWQIECERRQLQAMNDARRFLASNRVPQWRIHTCNKNARRGPSRIDWVGFRQCLRNPRLRRSVKR